MQSNRRIDDDESDRIDEFSEIDYGVDVDAIFDEYLETLRIYDYWNYVEMKYLEYCNTFSPEYLSGCPIHNYIKKHGSFKKAYDNAILEDFILLL